MPTTVRWLLAQRKLQLTLRAASSALNREIAWAHAIELNDPTPWVGSGGLVLTTGMTLPDVPSEQHAYVTRLAEAGLSALGFAVGPVHDAVPPALIVAAQAAGLPLIEIPLPTPLVALTRAIADRQESERAEVLRNVSLQMEQLTRASLASGPDGLVHTLASALEATIVVLDGRDEIQTATAGGAALLDMISAALPASDTRPDNFSMSTTDRDGYLVVQSVAAASGTWLLCVYASYRLEWAGQLLISHATSLIALTVRRSEKDIETERALRSAALRILRGPQGLDEETRHLAQRFGFTDSAPVRALLLAGVSCVSVTAAVEEEMAIQQIPFLAAQHDDHHVILMQVDEHLSAKRLANTVVSRIRATGNRVSAAGIGHSVALESTEMTIGQARFVADVAAAERRSVLAYDDLGVHVLLLAGQTSAELTTISEAVLGVLLEYDRGHRGDLVASIDAFLRHNGQWDSAANDLGVHRHTLRNRVRKVEALTGRRLDSAHDRSELLLAITALAMQKW